MRRMTQWISARLGGLCLMLPLAALLGCEHSNLARARAAGAPPALIEELGREPHLNIKLKTFDVTGIDAPTAAALTQAANDLARWLVANTWHHPNSEGPSAIRQQTRDLMTLPARELFRVPPPAPDESLPGRIIGASRYYGFRLDANGDLVFEAEWTSKRVVYHRETYRFRRIGDRWFFDGYGGSR